MVFYPIHPSPPLPPPSPISPPPSPPPAVREEYVPPARQRISDIPIEKALLSKKQRKKAQGTGWLATTLKLASVAVLGFVGLKTAMAGTSLTLPNLALVQPTLLNLPPFSDKIPFLTDLPFPSVSPLSHIPLNTSNSSQFAPSQFVPPSSEENYAAILLSNRPLRRDFIATLRENYISEHGPQPTDPDEAIQWKKSVSHYIKHNLPSFAKAALRINLPVYDDFFEREYNNRMLLNSHTTATPTQYDRKDERLRVEIQASHQAKQQFQEELKMGLGESLTEEMIHLSKASTYVDFSIAFNLPAKEKTKILDELIEIWPDGRYIKQLNATTKQVAEKTEEHPEETSEETSKAVNLSPAILSTETSVTSQDKTLVQRISASFQTIVDSSINFAAKLVSRTETAPVKKPEKKIQGTITINSAILFHTMKRFVSEIAETHRLNREQRRVIENKILENLNSIAAGNLNGQKPEELLWQM